ncbi:MAG: oligosaccharide flippase family protein [Anaerolineae bacterium]|nr:oligosaccharide flippase family protein [Anaerolineae bacterium]MDW8072174.1 oligosaccharide flippase family protein [Anaerolineae bacterium]
MNEALIQTVASRAIRGSLYSVGVALITLVLGFARAILLARLLLPEHFGVVTLAMFYVALVSQLLTFGLDQGLIHLQRDDEAAQGTYSTLRLGMVILAFLVLAAMVPPLARFYPAMPMLRWTILALAGINVGLTLAYVHETFLRRELVFRQIALTDLTASLTMTICAPLLAWAGWGLWALVAEQASGTAVRLIMNWLVYRRWPLRLRWDARVARRLWEYGRHMWTAGVLNFLNDRFDDFWIGTGLGQVALGYYSRAYEFVHYPRRIAVNPLIHIIMSTFARLQDDRIRLSQAFFRSAHLILCANFLVSACFGLVIPEFVILIIGSQWTPVILTFRLMVLYAFLDAVILVGQALVQACGQPRLMATAMMVQTFIFIPMVIIGAWWGGINGVALAVDGMMLVGAMILYRGVRQLVDFSWSRLIMWPLIATGVGALAGTGLEMMWVVENAWWMAALKLMTFTVLYGVVLIAAERKQFEQGLRWVWGYMRTAPAM